MTIVTFEHVIRTRSGPVTVTTDDSGVYVASGAGPRQRIPVEALDDVVKSMRRAAGHIRAEQATRRRGH